jgi:IS5 family transposase
MVCRGVAEVECADYEQLETMADRVRSVVRQTKARIFGGLTKLPDKIVSLFEPQTEIIRKGKARKPNEFGKLVQLQEAENQIITHYEVYDHRPADQRLLIPAVEAHRRKTGPSPKAGGSGRRLLLPN